MDKFCSLVKLFQISCLVIVLTAFAGCGRDQERNGGNAPWLQDAIYTEYLTMNAADYKLMTGYSSASTVDGLRIYKIANPRPDMFKLDDLLKRDFRYESRDKELIRKFLEAAQDRIGSMGGCKEDPNEASYHVILNDNTFMRAAYFVLTICKSSDGEYGLVYLPDGAQYSTSSLLRLMRSIDPVLHRDPQVSPPTH
jgi:hypothetical protein